MEIDVHLVISFFSGFFIPLSDDRILDWSKLNQIADIFKVHLKWKINAI